MAQPATNAKIEELRFRLKTDPKSRLFYQLAEELRRAGGYAEAENVLRHGLTVYPTYLAAWVSLGRVLREQKNDASAVEALNKALQLDPGNVVAARLLADAYFALGEKVEAIKKYKLVHALLPMDEDIRNVVEQLERELGPAPSPALPAAVAPVAEPEAEPEPVAAESSADAEAPLDAAFTADTESPLDAAFTTADTESPLEAAFTTGDAEPAGDVAPPEQAAVEMNPGYLVEAAGVADPDLPPPESVGGATLSAMADDAGVFTASDPFAADDAAGREPAVAPDEPPAPAALQQEEAESPFDRTLPPFGDAAKAFGEEVRLETATADVEPMARAHDDSPFEDPVAGFTSAAMEIEAPPGMQIVSAPLAAEVPASLVEALPTVDSTPVFDTPAPLAPEPDDAASTITMADLYVRQGLVEDARHIYEHILARDPGNDGVRAKLRAITPRVNAKVVALERWLSKVARKEVGRV